MKKKLRYRRQRTTNGWYWPVVIKLFTNPNKNRGELRCNGMVNSYCYITGIRYVTLVIKLVKRPEVGQDRIAITTYGPYPELFKKNQIYVRRKVETIYLKCNSCPL